MSLLSEHVFGLISKCIPLSDARSIYPFTNILRTYFLISISDHLKHGIDTYAVCLHHNALD